MRLQSVCKASRSLSLPLSFLRPCSLAPSALGRALVPPSPSRRLVSVPSPRLQPLPSPALFPPCLPPVSRGRVRFVAALQRRHALLVLGLRHRCGSLFALSLSLSPLHDDAAEEDGVQVERATGATAAAAPSLRSAFLSPSLPLPHLPFHSPSHLSALFHSRALSRARRLRPRWTRATWTRTSCAVRPCAPSLSRSRPVAFALPLSLPPRRARALTHGAHARCKQPRWRRCADTGSSRRARSSSSVSGARAASRTSSPRCRDKEGVRTPATPRSNAPHRMRTLAGPGDCARAAARERAAHRHHRQAPLRPAEPPARQVRLCSGLGTDGQLRPRRRNGAAESHVVCACLVRRSVGFGIAT